MSELSVKEMVSDGKTVKFKSYRKGILYYQTESGFVFEVPATDCGDAEFLNQDKAILFMRWIRKAVADYNKGQSYSEGDRS